MASYRYYQFSGALDAELVFLSGVILTDASGNVLNANPATANNQYGSPLVLPKGIASAVHTTSGLYRLTLEQAWYGLASAEAIPITPLAGAQATVLGTVDLTTLTLSTLNGLTLQTDADVGSNYTTSFTTPSSIADIAAQINAGNGGTSVVASIVTSITGAQYLKVVSGTLGAASTLAIASASTGDTALGMSNTTATAQGLGSLTVAGYNPRGKAIDYQPAQTIDLLYAVAGVGQSIVSGGFKYGLWLKNVAV